jgi:hypothetical protein
MRSLICEKQWKPALRFSADWNVSISQQADFLRENVKRFNSWREVWPLDRLIVMA